MVNIIVELSKYLMIILIAAYTSSRFSVFAQHDLVRKKKILGRQNRLMFTIQLIAYLVMFLQTKELELAFFYLAQVVLLIAIILLYINIYPRSSRLVVNNMCMLICVGFIMITRLDYATGSETVCICCGICDGQSGGSGDHKTFEIPFQMDEFLCGSRHCSTVVCCGFGTDFLRSQAGIFHWRDQHQLLEFVKILFVFYVASSSQDFHGF